MYFNSTIERLRFIDVDSIDTHLFMFSNHSVSVWTLIWYFPLFQQSQKKNNKENRQHCTTHNERCAIMRAKIIQTNKENCKYFRIFQKKKIEWFEVYAELRIKIVWSKNVNGKLLISICIENLHSCRSNHRFETHFTQHKHSAIVSTKSFAWVKKNSSISTYVPIKFGETLCPIIMLGKSNTFWRNKISTNLVDLFVLNANNKQTTKT